MESESAKPANSGPDAAGRAPPDDANRKAVERETIAASSSSFQGLVGGSSIGDLKASSSDPNQTLGLGRTIGRYKILKVLGSGSMGSVFLAHDSQLDRQVALKVPRLEHDSTGELSQRLYREARAAATLNHPNICPIYDVSEHEGTCFIAMGYVSGQPLAAYVASKKRQPEREAAKVVRKIALALEEAHAHGILHRDLKPTNIMIDKRGEPIVMDFGVACWFDDRTQTRLTQQGALVGTPAYMSPEQIEGRTKIGPASDIYSLGVLLYQILTGRCPFEGTVLNVISQVLHQDPPDAREFRPDLSPELIAICKRAMRKNPADRFPSMRDFAKALTAFLNDSPRSEKSPKQAAEVDARAVETIEFEPPKVSRPKHATPTPMLPARPRRGNRPRQQKQKRSPWPPAAVAVGVVTAVLVIGVVIGTLIVRRPGHAAVARNGQVASDANDAPECDNDRRTVHSGTYRVEGTSRGSLVRCRSSSHQEHTRFQFGDRARREPRPELATDNGRECNAVVGDRSWIDSDQCHSTNHIIGGRNTTKTCADIDCSQAGRFAKYSRQQSAGAGNDAGGNRHGQWLRRSLFAGLG